MNQTNPTSPEARQSRFMESLVDRIWQRSRERGRSEHGATTETLIYLSLFGRHFLFRGVEILRQRELIIREDSIYHGRQRVTGIVRRRVPEHQPGVTPNIARVQQHILSAESIRLQAREERAQQIIGSLLRQTVGETPQAVEDPTCIICMGSLELNDEVMVLPCAHWFCTECTSSWFRVGNSCPMCRGPVEPNPLDTRISSILTDTLTETPVELIDDISYDNGLIYGDYFPPHDDTLPEISDIDEDLLYGYSEEDSRTDD